MTEVEKFFALATAQKEAVADVQEIQLEAPWNLSRICRRSTYAAASNYIFDAYGCADTDAYVLDTGVLITHPQFEGRASSVANFSTESSWDDLNGHGTHVAGIIGSHEWGVCKSIRIKSVKILAGNGSGNSISLLRALSWIAQNHNPARYSVIK